jgi:hypothetical protein
MENIRCTSDSEGRLSRRRLRVREEKREGVWIVVWGVVMLSRAVRLPDERGEERRELVVEISESERLRLRTMVVVAVLNCVTY